VYQVVTMNGKTVSKESDGPLFPVPSSNLFNIILTANYPALDNPLLYLYSGDECYTGSGDCGTLQSYSTATSLTPCTLLHQRIPDLTWN
jgi:hypothetical protein